MSQTFEWCEVELFVTATVGGVVELLVEPWVGVVLGEEFELLLV
jgi:hypothetical protein